MTTPGQGRKRPMDESWGASPEKMFKGAGGKGMGMGMGKGKGVAGGKGKGSGGAVTNTTSVYVGGVPHDWDEAMLQGLFESSGTITKVCLMNVCTRCCIKPACLPKKQA